MSVGRIVGILVFEDLLSAKSIDEGCATLTCQSMVLQGRKDNGVPVPLAPQTMSEKRTPFFTFFFLRILVCRSRKALSADENILD